MDRNYFTMKILGADGKEKDTMIPCFRFMDLDLMRLLSAKNELQMKELIDDILERPHQQYVKGDALGYIRDVLEPFALIEPENALRTAVLVHSVTGLSVFPQNQVFA